MTTPEIAARVLQLEAEIARLEVLEAPTPVAGGGAITHLETQVLGAASAPVTFTSISQAYKHLLFVLSTRSSTAGEDDVMYWYPNNVGLSNAAYHSYVSRWGGSPKVSQNVNLASLLGCNWINGNGAPTGYFTPGTLWIFNYTSIARNRVGRGQWATGKDDSAPDIEAQEGVMCSLWTNVASAISRVDFDTQGSAWNFMIGSTFSLYGVG